MTNLQPDCYCKIQLIEMQPSPGLEAEALSLVIQVVGVTGQVG